MQIVQRRFLTPHDFASTAGVADRLRDFETRDYRANLLTKLDSRSLADAEALYADAGEGLP